jgi:hypothetical protein
MEDRIKVKMEKIIETCNAGKFLYIVDTGTSIKIQRDSETSIFIKKEHIEDLFMYDNNQINIYTKTEGFVFISLEDRVFITQL